jgi:hypothetical protein
MGTIKSEVAFQTTSASRVKFVRIFVFVVAGMAGLFLELYHLLPKNGNLQVVYKNG